jgi:hypothetical protein
MEIYENGELVYSDEMADPESYWRIVRLGKKNGTRRGSYE